MSFPPNTLNGMDNSGVRSPVIGVFLSWGTLVLPVVAIIGGVLHDDWSILLWLLGMTSYLVAPAGIVWAAVFFDDVEAAFREAYL